MNRSIMHYAIVGINLIHKHPGLGSTAVFSKINFMTIQGVFDYHSHALR